MSDERSNSTSRPIHCRFPDICGPANGHQCENWLRNLEGCGAAHAKEVTLSVEKGRNPRTEYYQPFMPKETK